MNTTEEGGRVAAPPVGTREVTRTSEPPCGQSGTPRTRRRCAYSGCHARQPGELAMIPTPASMMVAAWLEWFATSKQVACRAYLCTHYHLNALDAEALINTACLQVCRHWATLEYLLAYFWHTLKHAVGKQGQRNAYERGKLKAYAQQRRLQEHGAEGTAQYVADLLEQISPRQRHLLEWFLQGYDDTQVAAWLGTSPQAVRVGRHGAYCVLRAQASLSNRWAPRMTDPALGSQGRQTAKENEHGDCTADRYHRSTGVSGTGRGGNCPPVRRGRAGAGVPSSAPPSGAICVEI
jgi:hypothetical protein